MSIVRRRPTVHPDDRWSDFFVTVNTHYVPRHGPGDRRRKARELLAILDASLEPRGGRPAPIFGIIGHGFPKVREINLESASVEVGSGAPVDPETGRRRRGPSPMLHLHFKISIRHRIEDKLRSVRPGETVDIGKGRRRRKRPRVGLDCVTFTRNYRRWFDANWTYTNGTHVWAPLSLSSAEKNYITKDFRAGRRSAADAAAAVAESQEESETQAVRDVRAGLDRLRI